MHSILFSLISASLSLSLTRVIEIARRLVSCAKTHPEPFFSHFTLITATFDFWRLVVTCSTKTPQFDRERRVAANQLQSATCSHLTLSLSLGSNKKETLDPLHRSRPFAVNESSLGAQNQFNSNCRTRELNLPFDLRVFVDKLEEEGG
jgi:hypothetical protein